MKIEGVKNLNKNWYTNMYLNPRGIRVTGGENIPTIKTGISFSDTLKGLSDEEKLDKILDYFLRYTVVDTLSDNYFHAGNRYLLIGGTRTLKSTIPFTKKQNKKIQLKYQMDRINALSEVSTEKYNISLSSGCTSYDIDEDVTTIVLCSKEGKIVEMDEQFIESYLPTLFGDNIVHIEQVYEYDEPHHYFKMFMGDFIKGCDKEIKISYQLRPLISRIILNHNYRVRKMEEQKKLQMKLEGF